MSESARDVIRAALPHALARVEVDGLGPRHEGKVRDMYVSGDHRVLITTDRVSAFDRVLGTIPFKGQVLNQLSAWWFETLSDVVGHHMVDVVDPNVMLVRDAEPLPVEVIVRGYITGSTSTSLWTLYERGVDRPYGLDLPAGLVKNERLPAPVITPTTKAGKGEHDERLTSEEVVERGLVEASLWQRVREVALAIFARGQQIAERAGLILVDTKYEFGLIDGRLCLIDEVHTPDSSRYWVAETYAAAMAEGREPQQYDKEHLRLWLKGRGFGGDGDPPALTDDIRAELSGLYVALYEKLTGLPFDFGPQPAGPRVAQALAGGIGRFVGGARLEPLVPIIMGSASDRPQGEAIAKALAGYGIESEIRVASAHKVAVRCLEILRAYERDPRPKVYVTIAGRSNALSGLVDGHVAAPVIACPPTSSAFGGADIFSSLRMPSGVAPAVVIDPGNAALAAAKILGVGDRRVADRVRAAQRAKQEDLYAADAAFARERTAGAPS